MGVEKNNCYVFLVLACSMFFLQPAFSSENEPVEPKEIKQVDFPLSYGEIKAAALYWYSNQSGMGYTTSPQSTFTTSDFSGGHLVNPNYDWEPGFRIDLAYGFNKSHWSIGADLIWYHGKGRGSQNTEATEGLFPAFSFASDSLSTDYANSATIDWKLHFTLFDVLTSYEWCVNSWFSLIPSLGLRNGWIAEKSEIQYQGGTYAAGADIVLLNSHFYGIGPRLALKPQFLLGKGFSFYAEGAGTFFAGWFNIKQSETFLGASRAFLDRKVSGGRWAVDTTAGLVYTYSISNRSSISFDLGFDYLVFFSQNEFVRASQFSVQKQGTALSLFGLHASLGSRF